MSNNLQPDLHNNLHLTTLAQANVGTKYVITHCAIAPPLGVRLAEMGIVRNTALVVVKTAPTGDPLVIKLRGYMLCLRTETAKLITVAEYDDGTDGARGADNDYNTGGTDGANKARGSNNACGADGATGAYKADCARRKHNKRRIK